MKSPAPNPVFFHLLLLTLLSTIPTALSVNANYAYAVYAPEIKDLVFENHVLFAMATSGPIDCLRRCFENAECVGFTVTPEGVSQVTCRGQSNGTRTELGVTESEGTSAFVLPTRFLESDDDDDSEESSGEWHFCENDAEDCDDPGLWTCHDSQCLCLPGFYFSTSAQECVQECETNLLEDAFVEYSNISLTVEEETEALFDQAIDSSCETACLAMSNCVALVLDLNTMTCQGLQWSSGGRVQPLTYEPLANSNFYMRRCQ